METVRLLLQGSFFSTERHLRKDYRHDYVDHPHTNEGCDERRNTIDNEGQQNDH